MRAEVVFCTAVIAIAVVFLVLAFVYRDESPIPCAEFANVDRSAVPARCFSDFLGKDGGQ